MKNNSTLVSNTLISIPERERLSASFPSGIAVRGIQLDMDFTDYKSTAWLRGHPEFLTVSIKHLFTEVKNETK